MASKANISPRLTAGLFVLSALILCLFSQTPVFADPDFPQLTGRVVDDAGLLSPDDKQALSAELERLEEKSSDQVVVVTLPSLQGYAIEDFGYRLGRHWGIGTEKLNNGVLLIVAPKERKVRIEVGYGLEPILTDALSRVIIDKAILPRFRSGDFSGGIKEGVHDIGLVLTGDAAELEARAKQRRDADKAPIDWFTLILYIAIFILIFYLSNKGVLVAPGPGTGRARSGSGGRRSGGGFSGGGGSFGGGGASGSW